MFDVEESSDHSAALGPYPFHFQPEYSTTSSLLPPTSQTPASEETQLLDNNSGLHAYRSNPPFITLTVYDVNGLPVQPRTFAHPGLLGW